MRSRPSTRNDKLTKASKKTERDPERGSRVEEIAKELAEEITSGIHKVGERFPLELDLQSRFDVGRHTVREALKLLTEKGLITRRQKSGTFVLSDTPISPYVHTLRDLPGLLDFADTTRLDIRHISGVSASSRLLEGYENLTKGKWLRVAGLRTVRENGTPLCWSEVLVRDKFAPPREVIMNTSRAIYEETIRHNGLRLEYVEQEALAMLLPPAMSDIFNVPEHSAALLVKRRYVAHSGETFEISQNLYPAGRYKLNSIFRQRP
ncbi:GntR family transcriptional regulator [Pseudooceanicola sp.]|uniref:GntR family transcriptional regulator n=1 Tax=Pseudooceanicola sp. TaxID=1914328 RepID=UPI002628E688|nr:GntR family transcriptional regulator [Pseudooceanicola sp.]MDF1857179.1 GntR family transcriptional regulator [Pseudooceanicola sp.]